MKRMYLKAIFVTTAITLVACSLVTLGVIFKSDLLVITTAPIYVFIMLGYADKFHDQILQKKDSESITEDILAN